MKNGISIQERELMEGRMKTFNGVTFRHFDEPATENETRCDYCEKEFISWYNELFVLGYCEKCFLEIQGFYEKDGGG